MAGVIVSTVVAGMTGAFLVALLWPGGGVRAGRALFVGLASGLGLGLASWTFMLVLLGAGPSRAVILADAIVLAVLACAWLVWRRPSAGVAAPLRHGEGDSVWWPLGAAAAATAAAALAGFVATIVRSPHGGWDAWMTWNLRARLIFRGGDAWRDGFSETLAHSHPDYPLLIHGLTVRSWLYAGDETTIGPALMALVFTFASVLVAAAAVASLRGVSQGLLTALVLLGTPFLIRHGAAQYADVPVGYFIVVMLSLLTLHRATPEGTRRLLIVAGLAGGLAAWTKNEGLLVLAALGIAGGIGAVAAGIPRDIVPRVGAFALGTLPGLTVVAVFKQQLATANDLMSELSSAALLARLTDLGRYRTVASAYVDRITGFGDNGAVTAFWVLVVYVALVGPARGRPAARAALLPAVALAIVLFGHAAVFVATAEDLPRLLNSSLDRLLLQLWPSIVFTYFMIVRTPDEAATHFVHSREGRSAMVTS